MLQGHLPFAENSLILRTAKKYPVVNSRPDSKKYPVVNISQSLIYKNIQSLIYPSRNINIQSLIYPKKYPVVNSRPDCCQHARVPRRDAAQRCHNERHQFFQTSGAHMLVNFSERKLCLFVCLDDDTSSSRNHAGRAEPCLAFLRAADRDAEQPSFVFDLLPRSSKTNHAYCWLLLVPCVLLTSAFVVARKALCFSDTAV